MCSNVVFGAFTTNRIHAAIHLILGLIGIIAGMRKSARGYCTFLGVLLLIVGILHFMPVTGTYTSTWLNMNSAVAGVNIFLGIVALVVALSTGPGREVKR